MTSNLRIVGEKTLTSEDSNVSSNFTLPASSSTNWNDKYDIAYVHKATNPSYTDQAYYNWTAATAGTGGSKTEANTNADASICPRGWHLPTSGSGGEFGIMVEKYKSDSDEATSSAMRATPVPNFTFSGGYISGSEKNQGSGGLYWSSTSFGSFGGAIAIDLYIDNTSVSPTDIKTQYTGLSVRCMTPSS